MLGALIFTLLIGGVSTKNYTTLVNDKLELYVKLGQTNSDTIEQLKLALEKHNDIESVTYKAITEEDTIANMSEITRGFTHELFIVAFANRNYLIVLESDLLFDLLSKLGVVIIFSILGTYTVMSIINKAKSQSFTLQLKQVTKSIESIASIGKGRKVVDSDVTEIIEIQNKLQEFERQLHIDRAALVGIAEQDHLTKLSNRLAFDQRMEELAGRPMETSGIVGLIYLDLNDFKPLNDKYGHEFGDKVLKEFAQVLSNSVRNSDTPVRLGGDEFAVIVENAKDEEGVKRLEELLKDRVNKKIEIDGINVEMSASIGSAVFPTQVSHISELLSFADKEMYIDKNASKNPEKQTPKLVYVGPN